MKKKFLLFIGILLIPALLHAQEPASETGDGEFAKATVIGIADEYEEEFAGMTRTVQEAHLRVTSGFRKGEDIFIDNGVLEGRPDMRLTEGETVVVERITKIDGSTQYLIVEKYRLPSVIWLFVGFFALSVLLGGKMGFSSTIGLLVSIAILVGFVVPRIVAGDNPLLISVIGSFLIACTSLFLAHGFTKRTSIALLSTLLTLCCAILLSLFFVHFAGLYGMGSEEAAFLQLGALEQINLRGILLGGIIIGALGVLDDITTAQTAAIAEISKANPRMGFKALYLSGLVIGREHIASLINTLALAYIGASLPLFLLFTIDRGLPVWVILNSEFITEEVVRTLVGSVALLLAVPISTWFAAYFFQHGKGSTVQIGHSHHH